MARKPLSPEQIRQQVQSAVAEVLALQPEQIKLHSRFLEDLGATSLDLATLMVVLEEELDVDLPEMEARRLTTVHEAIDFISASISSEKEDV